VADPLSRKQRIRQTAQRNAQGGYDLDAILNRELYPVINGIEELSADDTNGSILQTRGGELIWYPPGDPGSILQVFSDNLPTWTETLPVDQLRSLIWNPITGQWAADNHSYRPVPITNPTGWPTTGPNGRWSFAQNSMVDTSGNGLDLTVQGGAQRYTYFSPTISAFKFDGATVLVNASAQPLLALTGEMTCVFGFILRSVGVQQFVIGYEAAGVDADPNNNTQWSLFYEADGSIGFISESGAGVNASHNVNSWAELGQPSLGGFTRYADGSVQMFLNQGDWGSNSGSLATPTGGANARFRIGGREGGAAPFSGTISGAVVYPFSITSNQWKIMYNATFGYWQGFTSVA